MAPAVSSSDGSRMVVIEESHRAAVVLFDEEDVGEAVAYSNNSLVGKIVTDKPIHRSSLQSALANIWCNSVGLQVEEVGEKVFLLSFDEEKDAKHVAKGSPWVFRNSWLLVQEWSRHVDPSDMKFTSA